MTTPPLASLRLVKTLLVLVALLVGVIIGLLTGILIVAGGGAVTAAFIAGGTAFGTAVPLVLLIENALGLP